MRLLGVLAFVAAVALCGCASIPLSTALSLSSLPPNFLAQVDPEQVRVKLSVPVGYELDVAASRLTLTLDGSAGSRSGAMQLTALGVTREARAGGLFSGDVPVSTYSLLLSPAGIRELRGLQQFMLSGNAKAFRFSVEAPFAKVPSAAQAVTFWADLKFSLQEPFMPLINGAKIRFNTSPASS